MKVKYIGPSSGVSLVKGNLYEVLGYENEFIRVVDETGEDYLYDPDSFVEVEGKGDEPSQVEDLR